MAKIRPPPKTKKSGVKEKATREQPKGFHKIQKYSGLRLPDGTHKRKVDKIKYDLIAKAKVKSAYKKLQEKEKKAHEADAAPTTITDGGVPVPVITNSEPVIPMHPSRTQRLEEPEEPETPLRRERVRGPRRNKGYAAEIAKAERMKAEREEAERLVEEARKDKERREKERLKAKKIMTERSVKTGQKKLGKQSLILLEKIKRQIGN